MADSGAITVVAIDGPAGSGKSTVARLLAERLGIYYLDTGAMYRCVALAVLRHGLELDDDQAVAKLAVELTIELGDDGTVLAGGEDVTLEIRSNKVDNAVSAVAANQKVRSELVERQRAMVRSRGGGVLEGRDIGTVVFPDADLKVYLTANPAVRASRRSAESTEVERSVTAADMERRDRFDSSRAVDPLRQASDAITVDTSDLTITEVVDSLVAMVGKAMSAPSAEF